jgi:hypothetical protein
MIGKFLRPSAQIRVQINLYHRSAGRCPTTMIGTPRALSTGGSTTPPPGGTASSTAAGDAISTGCGGAAPKSNNRDPVDESILPKKEQQRPRRLVVKKGVGNPSSTETSSSTNNNEEGGSTEKKSPSSVGVIVKRRRKPPIQYPHDIRDSFGHPILFIPQAPTNKNETRYSYPTADLKPRTVNASALLASKNYCVHSANACTSKSGTEAARRLLQGKQDFLHVMRLVVHSGRRPRRSKSDEFVLEGHGVPQELLQELLQLADDVLVHHDNAAACSFGHYRGELMQVPQAVRVRDANGTNRACPWPPVVPRQANYSWDDSMCLYLTVNDRMAKLLSDVLVLPARRREETATSSTSTSTTTTGSTDDDQKPSNLDGSLVTRHAMQHEHRSLGEPHDWNVEFIRGLYLPLRNNNNDATKSAAAATTCTVEWTLLDDPSAPGHVRVRLQGVPENNSPDHPRQRQAVTLSFDASFRFFPNG